MPSLFNSFSESSHRWAPNKCGSAPTTPPMNDERRLDYTDTKRIHLLLNGTTILKLL